MRIQVNLKRFGLIFAAGLITLASRVQAQLPIDGVHYPAGLEGIKGGSLPGPGIYFRDDNLFYTGTSDLLPDFNMFIYLQAPQLTWMTDWKILGANYGMDVMVPFAYKEVSYYENLVLPGGHQIVESVNDSRFGLGDIKIEPLLLSWHLKQFDFRAGYALWVPTGSYDNTSLVNVNLGDGCWSHMMTLGGVWYPDHDKSWAISLLHHFEFNSQVPGIRSGSTPGGGYAIPSSENIPCSTYTLEWGISKAIIEDTDIGVAGYYQRQFTDHDTATTQFSDSSVAGIGPEIRTFVSRWGLSCSLRCVIEFMADNRPKGNTINLMLMKKF
jgi:hypothetical protein